MEGRTDRAPSDDVEKLLHFVQVFRPLKVFCKVVPVVFYVQIFGILDSDGPLVERMLSVREGTAPNMRNKPTVCSLDARFPTRLLISLLKYFSHWPTVFSRSKKAIF